MLGLFETLLAFIAFFFVLYYYKIKFNFWKKRGVPGPEPILFFGNTKDVLLRKTNVLNFRQELYNKYKNVPLVGYFDQTEPILFVNDPVLIKDIFITDSAIFTSRGFCYSQQAEPLQHHILNIKTDEAQHIRAKVSPLFTPSKLRSMFPLFLERSKIFKDWLDILISQNKRINYRDVTARYIVDLSSIYLFGYDVKAYEDGKNKFLQYLAKTVSAVSWRNLCIIYLPSIIIPNNKLYDLIGYYMFHNAEGMQFFTTFVKDIDSYRKKYNIEQRRDLTDALMGFKENDITDCIVVANMYAFFIASFDTSSATVTNTMYEMALNQSVQDKLREEIKTVRTSNDKNEITYDNMNTMSYLDAVFKETLRKYPVGDVLMRKTMSSYTFRDSKITIPKNQLVGVPVRGIHYNPDIYPNPEVYDPERFIGSETAESKNSMHFIPFGHGPRNCIGERFGILQSKIAIITIIENYKIEPCKDTKMVYSSELFVQQARNMYLKLTKIN